MVDTQRNEFTLVKTIMIGVILLNLSVTLYVIMLGVAPSSISCSSASLNPSCQLQSHQDAITNTTNSIGNSFACSLDAVSPSNCYFKYPADTQSSTCLFSGCPLSTNIITIGIIFISNALLGVITFLFYILALVAQMFLMVTFVLFNLLPATLGGSNFLAFATIFQIIWSGTLLIIVAYAIYIILNRLPLVGK